MSRKAMEEYIYGICNDFDDTGANTNRFKSLFSSMSDKEFYKFMKDFIKDPNQNFKITFKPMKNTPTMEFFEGVAKKRGVSLYETLYMPYLNGTYDKNNAPASPNDVLVLDLNIKRLVQTVLSKTSADISIANRDMETGQVRDSDKHARLSDVEVIALLAQDQNATAAEYMNPRADDTQMMSEMLLAISEKGEVSMSELNSDILNKTALNTMNYYMVGGFLVTNIVDRNMYMLPNTIRDRENK